MRVVSGCFCLFSLSLFNGSWLRTVASTEQIPWERNRSAVFPPDSQAHRGAHTAACSPDRGNHRPATAQPDPASRSTVWHPGHDTFVNEYRRAIGAAACVVRREQCGGALHDCDSCRACGRIGIDPPLRRRSAVSTARSGVIWKPRGQSKGQRTARGYGCAGGTSHSPTTASDRAYRRRGRGKSAR
eukprot:COSAG05_NODE_105_length_18793_cov_115.346421_19_plen_186_part_00